MPRKPPRSQVVAEAIARHLKRFESDTDGVNALVQWTEGLRFRPFADPEACASGGRVLVTYDQRRSSTLTLVEAEGYLAWLDAGNVGKHHEWKQQRDAPPTR